MTTAHAHSLNHRGTVRTAKPFIAITAIQMAKVQRVVMMPSFAGWLVTLYRKHRSRQQLARLDARLLEDVGISEAQRQACLRKPLWKLQEPGK